VVPEPVIDRQVARQPPVAFLRVLEGHRVGPLPAEGLDKALGLAVGAGRVGPGADVLEAKGAAGFGKCFGDVGRAVVAHHLTALHALAVEPGHSPAQEADGRALLLVSEDLDVGQPCGVVDRYVDPVIAGARGASLLTIAGDAMSDPAEAGQLFDVDVNQVARCLALVALHRCLGVQVSQPPQAQVVQGPGHGGEGSGKQPGDVAQVQPLMA